MLVLDTIHACSELLLSGKTFAIDIKFGLNLLTRFQPFLLSLFFENENNWFIRYFE